MIACVLFDLDGTLADTAPDLANALNQTLNAEGHSPMAFEAIRPYVSLGADAMLNMAFPKVQGTPKFDALKYYFLDAYCAGKHRHTHLFPGIEAVLNYLDGKRITWGVVTNKLTDLTLPVMERLKLTERAACVVCGDSTDFKKPHPMPLRYACDLTRCAIENAVYIGDTVSDVEAGHRAGMKSLVVTYGYANEGDNPYQWGADGYIAVPEEVIDWLEKENSAG